MIQQYFSKQVATVKVGTPSAVQAMCAAMGSVYDKGAVFCECVEMGFTGDNLIYCRYGLSTPYLRVQDGWKVLIEPTIGQTERWFYTGIVDAAGLSVGDTNQLIIELLSGILYAATDGTVKISDSGATEPFVLGTKLSNWFTNFITNVFNAHVHLGVLSGGAVSGVPQTPATAPSDILSTKIYGK